MPDMVNNLYYILGISRHASSSEIRSRWRVLARKYHPDRNPDDPTAEEHFKEIQHAYRILMDPELRQRYDAGFHDLQPVTRINHYFYVLCDRHAVNCFDEICLTFTWSGNGRVFRKPKLDGFFITGSPYVSHRTVLHEGHTVKETHLTYIICPLKTGKLTIGSATITINGQDFETDPVPITSNATLCSFMIGRNADGDPFKLMMHYEFQPGEEPFRISELKKNHTLLVPRSRAAQNFHRMGSVIKAVFTIWGLFILSQYFDFNYLAGMAAGNILGGINCMILYRIAGVRSKHSLSSVYPLAAEYRDRGYFLGESTGFPMVNGNFFFHISRMLI